MELFVGLWLKNSETFERMRKIQNLARIREASIRFRVVTNKTSDETKIRSRR